MAPQLAVRDPLLALSSPRRREILRLVWTDERSAGDIAGAFEVTWPAISQNLRVLKDAGLIKERRGGARPPYPPPRAAPKPPETYLPGLWGRNNAPLPFLAQAHGAGETKAGSRRELGAP